MFSLFLSVYCVTVRGRISFSFVCCSSTVSARPYVFCVPPFVARRILLVIGLQIQSSQFSKHSASIALLLASTHAPRQELVSVPLRPPRGCAAPLKAMQGAVSFIRFDVIWKQSLMMLLRSSDDKKFKCDKQAAYETSYSKGAPRAWLQAHPSLRRTRRWFGAGDAG